MGGLIPTSNLLQATSGWMKRKQGVALVNFRFIGKRALIIHLLIHCSQTCVILNNAARTIIIMIISGI